MLENQPHRQPLACEQLEDRLALNATTFVKALYKDLLGRSAESSGLSFWVNQIENNGLSNEEVATDIWRSTEHRQDQVKSYYNNYFHRSADSAGLDYWTNVLIKGQLNEQGVETVFMTSLEFMIDHPTPDLYIQGLYLDILARYPTASEDAYWVNQLAMVGNIVVTGSILTSNESYTLIIENYYKSYLDRVADSNGVDNWLTQLQTGRGSVESVAEGILGSTEYANLHS